MTGCSTLQRGTTGTAPTTQLMQHLLEPGAADGSTEGTGKGASGFSLSSAAQFCRLKLHPASLAGAQPTLLPRGKGHGIPLRLRLSMRRVTPCRTLPPTA